MYVLMRLPQKGREPHPGCRCGFLLSIQLGHTVSSTCCRLLFCAEFLLQPDRTVAYFVELLPGTFRLQAQKLYATSTKSGLSREQFLYLLKHNR